MLKIETSIIHLHIWRFSIQTSKYIYDGTHILISFILILFYYYIISISLFYYHNNKIIILIIFL